MKECSQSTEDRARDRALILREELGLVWGKSCGDGGEKRILQASIAEGKSDCTEAGDQVGSDSLPTWWNQAWGTLGGQFLGADTNYTGLCKLLPAGRWGDTHWRRLCAGTTVARPQAPHPSFHFDTIPSKMRTFLFKKKGSSTSYRLRSVRRSTPQTSPARSSLFLCDDNDVRGSGSAIP